MRIFDGPVTSFAGNIIVDELHRSRPIKGSDGNDVLDGAYVEAFAAVGYASAFHLEDAHGLTSIRRSPKLADRLWGYLRGRTQAASVFLRTLFDNGKCLKPQKIHLEHAKLGESIHLVLSDDLVIFSSAQRDVFITSAVSNHDASRWYSGVPAHTTSSTVACSQSCRAAASFSTIVRSSRFFSAAAERVMFSSRNHPGEPIGVRIAPTKDAAHIAHNALCTQRAKSHDLRNTALAVFAANIINHLTATYQCRNRHQYRAD